VDANTFEMSVSLNDARLVSAVRALIDTAAQYAGCPSAAAARFARDVEHAIVTSFQDGHAAADGPLPVTVRRADGPIEVLVNGHVFSLEV
jgi:hypothetical protein